MEIEMAEQEVASRNTRCERFPRKERKQVASTKRALTLSPVFVLLMNSPRCSTCFLGIVFVQFQEMEIECT
jgi:hypothetical protein